jgi:hypothetical protein
MGGLLNSIPGVSDLSRKLGSFDSKAVSRRIEPCQLLRLFCGERDRAITPANSKHGVIALVAMYWFRLGKTKHFIPDRRVLNVSFQLIPP